MSHVAQIVSAPTEAADRPGFDRLWHPRGTLCAVCTSRKRECPQGILNENGAR